MSDLLPISIDKAPNVYITIADRGERIEGWEGLQVIRAIDAGSDAFAFSVPFDASRTMLDRYRPFKPVVVRIYMNDQVIITGYIEQVSASTDGSNRQLEIQGRSATGVLIDWSAGPPFEFSGMTFNDIARAVTRQVNDAGQQVVQYTVSAQPNTPVLADVSIDIGQSVYDFLYKLAEANGLWPQPTPAGALIFKKIDSKTPSVADLVEGESPVMSVSATHDVTKRFQRYRVVSQNEGDPNAFSEVSDIETLGLGVRGRVIVETQQESADLRQAALRARARAILDSYNPSATVVGWTNGTRFWTPGDIVRVHAPGAFIRKPIRMMIMRATMQLDSNGGQITQLDLSLPEAFDLTTPQEVPWLE